MIKKILDKMNILIDKSTDNAFSANVIFSETFPAFEGHFPEKKILPGVIQILIVGYLLERYLNRSYFIKEVVQAKYKTPVLPDEMIVFRINFIENKGEVTVNASLSKDNEKKTDIKIKLS